MSDTSQMPAVSGEYGEKPALTFPDAPAPAGLQIKVLHEGDGEPVQGGQHIVCHYLGQVWGGNVFDNSFDRGEPLTFMLGAHQVIPGWDRGLEGVPVGSRILLSIPSELAYGDRGIPQAGIKGGDTLVFVTDVVGAL
ncbi:MAG: FKBP-type peptidyl-prolyl cis-trans isomerase [Actinomycetaceae bacterium]|nr:FKBP-type peptidyl-prolyl cis-trans isomerase [Actinomycetaceae bacterium]